jgi:hypothetical protein
MNTATIEPPTTNLPSRRIALVGAIGLLFIAVLSPFARFGVLQALVIPGDAAGTLNNIVASEGLFRAGVAALLIVVMFDIVVAWAIYVLLRPTSPTVALLDGWLRLAYAGVFAAALANLVDVTQLVGGSAGVALRPEQLETQVMALLGSFDNGWIGIALAIFGLHLACLGTLLFQSAHFPKFLGVLVIVAGAGYLADSFTMILLPDIPFTFSVFTFVGEALLMVWLFIRAARGFGVHTEPGHLQATTQAVAKLSVRP